VSSLFSQEHDQMPHLNYHHLRYFWAIANEGSLTKAADRLNVSASSLSVQIKSLEEQLGHSLFQRHGRSMQLTEAGRIALDYSNALFKLGDEFIGLMDGLQDESKQVLRVGAVSTLSRNFQIEFLRPLFNSKDVEMYIYSSSFEDLLSRLRDHKLDIVLANKPAINDQDRDWRSVQISEQSVSLIGAKKLLNQKFKFPQDLEKLPIALPARGCGIRNEFDAMIDSKNIKLNIVAEVDDMAMLRLIAREEYCMVLVPPVVVIDELACKALVQHFTFPRITESFYAITLKRQFPSPILKKLKLMDRSSYS
jgi:LysR family transcriptional regulator, transcriptional activator of nhaA